MACKPRTTPGIEPVFDLRRMEGKWVAKDNNAEKVEVWKLVSPNHLSGMSYDLIQGDTIFSEQLTIMERDSILTYFAGTVGEYGEEIIPYIITKESVDQLEFSNPDYDFPKYVVYVFKSDSLMQGYVEGPNDGKNFRRNYNFVRQ